MSRQKLVWVSHIPSCGSSPQLPEPPLRWKLTFSLDQGKAPSQPPRALQQKPPHFLSALECQGVTGIWTVRPLFPLPLPFFPDNRYKSFATSFSRDDGKLARTAFSRHTPFGLSPRPLVLARLCSRLRVRQTQPPAGHLAVFTLTFTRGHIGFFNYSQKVHNIKGTILTTFKCTVK